MTWYMNDAYVHQGRQSRGGEGFEYSLSFKIHVDSKLDGRKAR